MSERISLGYLALIERFDLKVIPNYRASYAVSKKPEVKLLSNGYEEYEYSLAYAPKSIEDPFSQLEFALKYDGVNLEVLSAFFEIVSPEELEAWILSRPTSKYCRVVWFLYEFLTANSLNLDDVKKVKYTPVLDSEKYFTGVPKKSARHGVVNNLLGSREFSPMIRRTEHLKKFAEKKLALKAQSITEKYSAYLLERANRYLLTKETRSSYQIEQETPTMQRLSKFVDLIRKVDELEILDKNVLIECQNSIVDPRFSDKDYRITQNYVGESFSYTYQKIHYISPKPEDLPELMDGFLGFLNSLSDIGGDAVVLSAAVSFGFVFLHPFEDGNGRLHRFLIHYVLNRLGFAPEDLSFPVSAVILKNMRRYDYVLESFSRPLLDCIDQYEMNDDGKMIVDGNTAQYYKYIDYTSMAEYLYECIEETIEVHLSSELEFLVGYDEAKKKMREVVDLPDRLSDLFIKFIMQNNGVLSAKKREKYFDVLTGDEVKRLSSIVYGCLNRKTNPE